MLKYQLFVEPQHQIRAWKMEGSESNVIFVVIRSHLWAWFSMRKSKKWFCFPWKEKPLLKHWCSPDASEHDTKRRGPSFPNHWRLLDTMQLGHQEGWLTWWRPSYGGELHSGHLIGKWCSEKQKRPLVCEHRKRCPRDPQIHTKGFTGSWDLELCRRKEGRKDQRNLGLLLLSI